MPLPAEYIEMYITNVVKMDNSHSSAQYYENLLKKFIFSSDVHNEFT